MASVSSSQTVTEGQAITLSVSVNGTAPFTYQWQKGGAAISGATNSTYTLDPIRVADAGTYTVVVTNAAGNATSGPVVLAVRSATAPTISYSPGNTTVTAGQTLSLDAGVNGTPPFTYVWKQGTTVVLSTTSSSANWCYYTKSNVQLADAGSYTVTITNFAGSVTSNPATVTVVSPTPPSIISMPSNPTVDVGGSFWLSPNVTGTAPITYQWYKDGAAITGATSYYYYINQATATDAGTYTLKATNAQGSVTSSGVVVTVRPPVAPTVTSVSGPVAVAVGGSFSLSVSATGTAPVSYQWRKDGQAIAGATSSYFSKSDAQLTDTGAYTVVVTNAQGTATSAAVTVTVTNARPPVITYMPGSFTLRQGDWVGSINVGASGTGTLSYQWSKDGTPIAGATNSSLYFYHNAAAADAGSYTVVVTNSEGAVTSPACRVTILPPLAPAIATQLVSRAVHQGQSLDLQANVSGSGPFTYQWFKDGVAIPGATSSYYSRSNMASSDAGVYSYTASNSSGTVTSEGATISVLASGVPQITSHPASASLLPGDYFSGIYVGYRSDTSSTVQWYKDGLPIAGATGTSYSISNAQPSAAGSYHAIVTNAAGSVTSNDAIITVDSNVNRPVITFTPGGQAIAGGNSATLTITTSGSGETVQWYKDGVLIPNGTTKTYSFSSFAASSAGTYTAQVTNATGTYTSRAIPLELLNSGMAPVITVSPASTTIASGQWIQMSCTVEGETPISYQWYKNGTAIVGETSSYFNLTASSTTVGNYSVTATNRNGTATSNTAAVTLAATAAAGAPVITSNPASRVLTAGNDSVYLSVSVLDSTGVAYQWYKDGTALSGATSSSYSSPTSATAASAGRYHVVVTNSSGSVTSDDAVIAVTNAVIGPSFTTQPTSQSKFYGNTVSFTAAATGTGTISYQWRKDGVAISGGTSNTLTIANAQSSDAGTYTLVATDSVGSTSSLPAVLTLAGGSVPYIISAPTSASVSAGGSVTFTASAGGTPNPTVQWKKDGVAISGATSDTLVINNAQLGDAGTYTVVATNGVGSVTSTGATLTVVYPPPSIAKQPTGGSVQAGGQITFSVTVASVPAVTYQWRKNGAAIPGATSSSLVLSNVQAADAGRYSVTVSSAFGSATSAEAVLSIGNPVTVTAPQSQVVYVGATATFAATVTSVDPLQYQWARNGAAIAGATATTLTLTNVQMADSGTYTLGISRADGSVVYPLSGSGSLAAILTVVMPPVPVFSVQPKDVTTTVGGKITLPVLVSGTGTISYQWYKNGQPLSATGNTLTIVPAKSSDAGDYYVIATDSNGSTTSVTVHVTVAPSPFAGTYFGSTGAGDSWALSVSPDGDGTFLAYLGSHAQAIVSRGITISATGAFSFGSAQTVAADGAPAYAAWLYGGQVTGTIGAGAVTGQIVGLGTGFSGLLKTGSQTALTGGYQAVSLASGLGEVDTIAAPDGTLMLVALDASGARGGRGTVTSDGTFVMPGSQYKYVGQISASGTVQGTYVPVSGTPVSFATAATTAGPERLVNVSTRGVTAPDDGVLTAGFVVTGSIPKDVLIRAIGPGLTKYSVSGVLPNPRLKLFKGTTPIMDNDDWSLGGFAAQITDAGNRLGAFPLEPGSADAAVVAKLDPGSYTVQVTSGDSTPSGVVLVEAYDASQSYSGSTRLINVSTRGPVGSGDNVLIAGVAVSGTSAKKLLIRAVGPGLSGYGLTGFLPDPKLQLFEGSTLLRENDNWSDSRDADAIATAANSVGAFSLTPGSKDASLLVYLMPGNYTAEVSGVAGATGVALVEVYEVP
ncbi:MAG TPA: immunoglobulin domain-containing protein [Opitutaceae bacterium]|nr:immunoglobulin domain-containing protein [Opitutaceae bacterium]